LSVMVDEKRASCVSANFFVGFFASDIELVVPSSRVLGDRGLQRAVLSCSREESHAETIKASIMSPVHKSLSLLGNGDHTIWVP
jgi:hypothetical protein